MAEDFDLLNETGAIEAPCWRNLWFVRDGRSYRGPLRFRSEREATALGNRWMDLVKSGGVLMPDGSIMPRAAITHFIPMPGRGAGSVAVVYPQSLGITLGGRCAPRHVRRGWSGVP